MTYLQLLIKDKVDNILHTINNTTKNIKFTKEEEHDNKLACLDVLLTKIDDCKLNTQVYRKNTYTDQLRNCNSNRPTQHNICCIDHSNMRRINIITKKFEF